MLVLAWGAVGPCAAAEFDFALIEVFFELDPFLVADRAVFVVGAGGSPAGEEVLVVRHPPSRPATSVPVDYNQEKGNQHGKHNR